MKENKKDYKILRQSTKAIKYANSLNTMVISNLPHGFFFYESLNNNIIFNNYVSLNELIPLVETDIVCYQGIDNIQEISTILKNFLYDCLIEDYIFLAQSFPKDNEVQSLYENKYKHIETLNETVRKELIHYRSLN